MGNSIATTIRESSQKERPQQKPTTKSLSRDRVYRERDFETMPSQWAEVICELCEVVGEACWIKDELRESLASVAMAIRADYGDDNGVSPTDIKNCIRLLKTLSNCSDVLNRDNVRAVLATIRWLEKFLTKEPAPHTDEDEPY